MSRFDNEAKEILVEALKGELDSLPESGGDLMNNIWNDRFLLEEVARSFLDRISSYDDSIFEEALEELEEDFESAEDMEEDY